jgi:hypothetical protein
MPHSVTHQAPANLLFNRAINVKLPQSQPVAPADLNHQQAFDASCKSRKETIRTTLTNETKPSICTPEHCSAYKNVALCLLLPPVSRLVIGYITA